jgi:cobalt/nickel transport protein
LRPYWPFLVVSLILAAILSHFASSFPDGLEKVSETLGFAGTASLTPVLESPAPDYTIPFLGEGRLSTSLAGILGVLICFVLPFGFYLLRRK